MGKARLLVLPLLLAALLLTTAWTGQVAIVGPGQEGVSGDFEIFTWWTAGGEADGLNALLEVFQERYPDVNIINATVAGGAGMNARAVLKTRMLGGNPPDTFQVHGGQELIASYVVTGYMEPITFLWEEEGWLDVFPQDLIDMVSYEGEIYSVPANVHRSNVLWYNKAIFEEYGLEPPETWDDFFEICDVVEADGITCLSLGDVGIWATVHLFESVLVSELGAEGYQALWNGELDWTSDEVKGAFELLYQILQHVNEDHGALSWDQAVQLVVDGEAAMNLMGDWAEGYFTSVGWTPNVEYGWVPSPGTAGTFIVVTDTFGLPLGAPNRDAAIAFLRVLGSVEGQDAFNPLKGSIPARVDTDRSLYDEYLQSSMDDFAVDTLVPSLAHGSAAPESFGADFGTVMSVFVATGDVDLVSSAAQQICVANGICQ